MVRLVGCLLWVLLMLSTIPNWFFAFIPVFVRFLRSPFAFFQRNVRSLRSFEDPCALEHEYHTVNGVRLHVAVGGRTREAKPLMLFVHGFPEAWFSWRHQLKAFQSSYEVAAVELRGYGLSDKPQGRSAYRMHELVADLAELIPSLGHKSCVLVGHDWGGTIAWALATKHAELLDKLVVMSVPPMKLLMENMDSVQKKMSTYMWTYQMPIFPELSIASHSFEALDDCFTGPKMGTKTPGAISADDLERYKANIAQPGALTAALNYYRASIDSLTWNPSPRS